MVRSQFWVEVRLHTIFDISGESSADNCAELTKAVEQMIAKLPGTVSPGDWRMVAETHDSPLSEQLNLEGTK